jgi:hypothetical protein
MMFEVPTLTDLSKLLTLPMLFDGGVALLLAVTLLFVQRLSRRIAELRRERVHFDAAIERFAGATAEAQKAMAELRQLAAGEGRVLQDQVKKGAAIADDLEFLIGRATAAADRLETVIGQSRQAEARKNGARPAELREGAASVKETPRMNPRDLARAAPLARAIEGDRDALERNVGRSGPATVARRPITAETLPEGERSLLKALAGLR